MPQLDLIGWAFWLAVIAGEGALSLVLLRKRAWRQWPAVCVYVWFRLATSLFLLVTYLEAFGYDNTPAVYFYGYWACQGICAFLQLWIVTEIGCNVAPTVGRILQRIIPTVGLLYFISAYLLVRGTGVPWNMFETQLVVDLNRAASIAWLVEFVCLSYVTDFLGISWKKRDINVATGFTIQAAGDTGISWMLSLIPGKWSHISNAQSLIWLSAMAWWAITFLRTDETEGETSLIWLRSAARNLSGAFGGKD
jgi:hypothetical protein